MAAQEVNHGAAYPVDPTETSAQGGLENQVAGLGIQRAGMDGINQ